MADRVGQRLGNYRLIRLLGQGGFAEVYLGQHIRLNIQVAIKILHTQLAGEDVASFHREAQIIASLRHPHIVRLLDFDVKNSLPFLIMDYAPNGSLRHLFPKGTPLPLDTIIDYVKQVAAGLQYAHDTKVIHRDIKPGNMLLGENHQVLLSDFGIALITQSTWYQNPQEVVGTAAYMAPEQLQGKPRRASDQYSLGIVVYEWLCGDRPFHGSFTELVAQHLAVPPPPLREKVPAVSPHVEQVVMRALAKDPEQRFGSVQAFATALEQACQSHISLPRSRAIGVSRRQGLPRHWIVLLMGLALLVIAGSLGLFSIIRTNQITTNNASTPSIQMNATSTANAAATVTATALYNIYVQATSGTPVIDDPLSDNSKGYYWAELTASFGTCAFTRGAYHLTVSLANHWIWCTGRSVYFNFNNFALQIQMSMANVGEGGIVFGATTKSLYKIYISSHGIYTLFQYAPDNNQFLTLRNGTSSAIKTGLNQVNVITVIVNNKNFYFYVNKQYVTSANISTYNAGLVGFTADSFDQATEAVFRNAKVWIV